MNATWKRVRTWGIGVVAVVAGLSTIALFAEGVGYTLDRPVFRNEFIQIAEPALRYVWVRKRRELFELEAALVSIVSRGDRPTAKLIDEITLLREEVENLVL